MFHLDLPKVGALASFTYTADAIRRYGAIASVELSNSRQYAELEAAMTVSKRGHEVGQLNPMHVMQLPQTSKGEAAFNSLRNEMIIFKERLEKEFGIETIGAYFTVGWKMDNQRKSK